jgi:hypothetical protein
MCIYIPKSLIEVWVIRAYWGYQIKGFVGLIKSLLYTLGWRSA